MHACTASMSESAISFNFDDFFNKDIIYKQSEK